MERHNIDPVFDNDSRVLILGSFPSVKSREKAFFYGHPQNRFWKVIAGLFNEEAPETVQQKKGLLLRNHIAVWDVIASCEITGSADQSISNVTPNDLDRILSAADIRKIFCNGSKSFDLYMNFIYPKNGIKPEKLPSTSPANAAFSLERLLEKWKIIVDFL
ncbi:MAG: DNA-deoxyinosine glycosylase [Erysipelotrichaceae bacterium]|nr:DNA-deoxyinosine glycosylase [Erysipelotrichaceae bacterium]